MQAKENINGNRLLSTHHVFRQYVNVGILFVGRVTFRMERHRVAQQLNDFFKRVRALDRLGRNDRLHVPWIRDKLLAQIDRLEREGSTRVLLLRQPTQVGRQSNLRFGFLFAVAKVVVRQNCHHDSTLVAQRNLEGFARVVELLRIAPAHARRLLLLGGLIDVRQTDVLLFALAQVGCEHHGARGSGPVARVQSRIVLGEVGVSRVAKDAFHKVQVGDASSGNEKAHFQALFGRNPRDFGAHQRT